MPHKNIEPTHVIQPSPILIRVICPDIVMQISNKDAIDSNYQSLKSLKKLTCQHFDTLNKS